MKKIICLVLFLLGIMMIVSCGEDPKNPTVNAPVFSGVEDITIEKGATFKPLEGVTVTDVEDGNINVASKSVVVNARALNVNVEGVYDVIYTAYDSDGNETVVTRKVTVVFTDSQAPDLYGVADTEITVGDPSFTVLKDVQAIDTIDGDLTKDIKVEGDVDVWTLGEYKVDYKVADKSGNEKKVTRTVKVTTGNFAFNKGSEIDMVDGKGKITGGTIIPALGDYTVIKVSITMKAAKDMDVYVKLAGTTYSSKPTVVKDEKAYDFYFRTKEALNNAEIEVSFGIEVSKCEVFFAESGDSKAPVITRAYEKDIVLPVGLSKEEIKKEILRGVSAEDEIEGNLTSLLDVNFKDADLTKAGEYKVEITCKDTANNEAKVEVNLALAMKRDTNWFTDPTFDGTNTTQIVLSSGGGGQVTMAIVDGMLQVNTVKAGGWASADSPYLKGLTTKTVQAGYTYMVSFDVKADKERTMRIRAGLELWDSPWMEDFYDSTGLSYQLTTEWQTVNYYFFVPAEKSSCGSDGIKFEIQLGSIYYADNENNNITYIDNMHLYLLSNESNAPVVAPKSDIKTKFSVGDTLPDFTQYITATDVEDGNITITADMVDASAVDMTKVGKYKVVYTVIDSDQEKTEYELEIEVLAAQDTEGPVVSIPDYAITMLQSFLPIKEGTDISDKIGMILGYVSIVDNVDGVISPSLDMVDLDGLNLTSANTGVHKVKIQCKDSFGNESNVLEIEITVIDNKAPVFVGVRNYTVLKGATINPLKGVEAWDITDGVIALTLADIGGFDAFLDATGKVIGDAKDYQVSYKVKDQAGNEATATAIVTVKDTGVTYNDKKTIDLLSQKAALEGTKSTVEYDKDGVATVKYGAGENMWASAVKFKYQGVSLEKGVTYKFVFEVQAELPREMLIYFVDGNGNKLAGWENADTYNRLLVGLTNGSYVYEYEFTVESDAASNCTMEVQFGWEEKLLNAGKANIITIKQIKLLSSSTKEDPQGGEDLGTPVHSWGWEDATVGTNGYTSSKWVQQKLDGGNLVNMQNSQINCRMKGNVKVCNFTGGWGQERYFTYSDGESLGVANTMTLQLGNYYNPLKPIQYKIVIIDKAGNEIYLKGSADSYETMNTTTDLESMTLTFDEVEVKAIRFIVKSDEQGNQYLYCGPIKLYDVTK